MVSISVNQMLELLGLHASVHFNQLAGTGQSASIPFSSIQNTNDFSVTFWSNGDIYGPTEATAFSSLSNNRGIRLWVSPTDTIYRCEIGTDQGIVTITGALLRPATEAAWIHVSCTHDSTTKELKLYIDALLVAETTIAGTFQPNNANPIVIADSVTGNQNFHRRTDELA